MPYVQLDDQIAQHPKVLRAGAEAAWLWACAIAYCNRQLTDGYVPTEALATMGAFRTPVRKLATTLVSVGLFDQVDAGYRIHDYLAQNPDRSTVLQRRALAADRKARQRDRVVRGRGGHAGVTAGHPRDGHEDTSVTVASSRGRVPTPTPTPTDNDRAEPRGESSPSLAAVDLHGWRIAALELVELWRQHGPGPDVPDVDAMTSDSRKRLREGLALRALDAWEALFRRVSRSDYLAGRGEYPAISLWKTLQWADRIEAGEFDPRPKVVSSEPVLPQDRVVTPAELDAIRDGQRLAAEERAQRDARGETSAFQQFRQTVGKS